MCSFPAKLGRTSELNQALGEQRVVSSIGEVWRLANEGRGRLLLVEEDFHYPAQVDETGMHLRPDGDASAPNVIDDAVDALIETVLRKSTCRASENRIDPALLNMAASRILHDPCRIHGVH